MQVAANDGEIVIAGKKESSVSGHVALAVPGNEVSAKKEKWGGSAPVGMDTGKDKRWSQKGMNYSWSYNTGVKFYKYTGERSGTTDNKTYYGGTIQATTVVATSPQIVKPKNGIVILINK